VFSVTDPHGRILEFSLPGTRNTPSIIFMFHMPLNRMLISLKDVTSEIQAALQSLTSPIKSRTFNAATAVDTIPPPKY
jgi:hypothetical protein